jgi:hypothetical protein
MPVVVAGRVDICSTAEKKFGDSELRFLDCDVKRRLTIFVVGFESVGFGVEKSLDLG